MRVGRAVLSMVAALALLAPAAAHAQTAGDTAAVYLTTPGDGKRLQRQPDARFAAAQPSSPVRIDVDPGQRFQRIRGFGAAFTDSSAWLLSQLPADARLQALQRLFDPAAGIGLSVMRVPMGASDFAVGAPYTYDDLPAGQTDPDLARFSIDHDRAYVLPVIREALAVNPHLRLIANPWSPPAWMKTNASLFGVAVPGGPGTLRPDMYAPLARYFVRFVQAYAAEGVPIWAVTPQNEPLQPTADYPGMFLSSAQEALFVTRYLRPALDAAGLRRVRIYGYDYTWLGAEHYVPSLVAAQGGARGVDGIAYHCYFGAPEAMGALHALLPKLDAIEDECSTGISVLSPIQTVIRSVNQWASTVLMWNVALDPSGGPKMGSGCLSCIGVTTVDPSTGTVAYTGNYWQLGQASKFVQRGARRIAVTVTPDAPAHGDSPVGGIEAAGFANPDGTIVVVVTSSGPGTSFDLRRPDGTLLTSSLPSDQAPNGTDDSEDAGVETFVWQG